MLIYAKFMFKELPEGQTHYENDGCSCPDQNKITLKTLLEKFDKEFGTNFIKDSKDELKQFLISSLKEFAEEINPELSKKLADEFSMNERLSWAICQRQLHQNIKNFFEN